MNISKNKILPLIWIILFLISVSCTNASVLSGNVVSVADGDTITILSSGNVQTKIRLYGIDCPEKAQPFGNKAKQFVSGLVYRKTVEVTPYDIDKYGRTVGVVQVDGINVNEDIIRAGLARQYRKYCKEQFCDNWISLEAEAKKAGRGLWREGSPIPPWEWRKGMTTQNVPVVGGRYHGNQNSRVFHGSSCKHFNCKNCLIILENRDEAIKEGFRPCGMCRP